MLPESIRAYLEESNPEALTLDGCDRALIGVAQRCGQPDIAVYSWTKLVDHFIDEFSSDPDCDDAHTGAIEWIEHNCRAWLGPNTPIIMYDREEDEGWMIHG